MGDLRIHVIRGQHVESVHRVSVAVADSAGALIAAAGNPDLITYWRSAAKPFQALPLVEDGVLTRYGLGGEELALACASHSSESPHLAVVDRFLARIGCREEDLACGTHPPLGSRVAREVAARGAQLTPRWNNCSGKHAGMLALARHHGWPVAGYAERGHPVQDRILEAVCRQTGLSAERLWYGVDGCRAVNFGLPLRHMAVAYARLAGTGEPAAAMVRTAMMDYPDLVAGEGRFCTDLMRALPARIVAKVGAGGVYCAGLVPEGLGVALKIEDGDMVSAPPALLEVLIQLTAARRCLEGLGFPPSPVERWARKPVLDTRGGEVGSIEPAGRLRFPGAAR